MLLWIILACLTAIVLLVLLRPLAGQGIDGGSADAFDSAVYRDQLGEIESDRARGLIGEEEAEAARVEIARRLLAADSKAATSGKDFKRHWPHRHLDRRVSLPPRRRQLRADARSLRLPARRRRRVVRLIGALTDVSEQRRLLDELRDAVLVRDDFLSFAGHELRTPLAALSAQLLGLKQLPLDDARRADKLGAAERQVRGSRSSSTSCSTSRASCTASCGSSATRRSVGVVGEAAARLAEEFQRAARRSRSTPRRPVAGRWDRLRIDLVVTNLLTNALRYGERKPVRVTVRTDGDRAVVIVEDHGLGIRPEDQERIFERFVRAVPSRQFGGLGVGLVAVAADRRRARRAASPSRAQPGAGSRSPSSCRAR